jgi:ribosomal protein L29
MAWSNSREELQRELRDVRRDLDDLKRQVAARHAAHAREIDALRTKSDAALDRVLRTFERYAMEQKSGFNPSQPRVPADDIGLL